MALRYEERGFARDVVSADIAVSANDGVTQDDDGLSFDWDTVMEVDASSIPSRYTTFFEADSFKVLRNVTIARPIEQKYVIDGKEYTFKKPAEELKKAAWSFDNTPHPLGHPRTKHVASVDDVHGFWKNPTYDDTVRDDGVEAGLSADIYLPANDEKALSYVSDNGDVSVGFWNRLAQTDEDGVDAYQTDIYGDHVASVEVGRCSEEDGCGINADHAAPHSTVLFETDGSEPSNDGGEAAEEDEPAISNDTSMSENGCGCGGDDGPTSDFVGDMAVDAIAQKNDKVAALREDRDSLKEDTEDLREFKESVTDAVEAEEDTDVTSEITEMVDRLDEMEDLREQLDEYHEDERQTLVEEITEMSDYEEDELEDMDLDALEDKKETLQKAVGDSTVKTSDGGEDATVDEGSPDLDPEDIYNKSY